MIPLNLVLAATFLILACDYYQIVEIFRDFQGTYHFTSELLKSSFSTVVMAAFIVTGFFKNPDYRKVRLLFLFFLFLDMVYDVMQAIESDGKTSAQIQEIMKQRSFPEFYFKDLLPVLIGCCIVVITAISFQMGKPFFFIYPQTQKWQARLMKVYSILYYLETVLALLLVVTLFNSRV